MDAGRIESGGIGITGRAFHEGLVAEKDMAEATIIALRPEGVAGALFAIGQETAILSRDISRAQDLAEGMPGLAFQGLGLLDRIGEGEHVRRDAAMDDENVPVGQTQEGNGRCEKGAVCAGQGLDEVG